MPECSTSLDSYGRIKDYIIKGQTDKILSLIELLIQLKFQNIDGTHDKLKLSAVIVEINKVFRLNKIGYEIVRVSLKNDLEFIPGVKSLKLFRLPPMLA